jgi:hypothetical protein
MRILKNALLVALLLGAGLTLPARGSAETQQFGAYEVHYSVFVSSFLQPAVAESYGIVRARDRAVLNIAVRLRGRDGATRAVASTLDGTRGDLIYKEALRFREIREQDVVYYLADFPFIEGETHYFDIRVRPEGETGELGLKFSKTLYED